LKHTASKRFWQLFDDLPAEVQVLSNKSFAQLKADPTHPALAFKSVGNGRFQSVRVGLYHRALGVPAYRSLEVCTGSGSARTASTTSLSANPSIERTFQWLLRTLWPAAHVER